MCGAVEKGHGKVQVELNRCAMEAMRAEKHGRGGGGGGLCMLEVFAFSNAARVRIDCARRLRGT